MCPCPRGHSSPFLKRLSYLRQALKDGPARRVIEGLSGSGGAYCEAIDMTPEALRSTTLAPSITRTSYCGHSCGEERVTAKSYVGCTTY